MTDEREAADALADAIDEIHRLEAWKAEAQEMFDRSERVWDDELTELRALKAKVDGCSTADDDGLVATEDGKRFLYADDLLPWLRETT